MILKTKDILVPTEEQIAEMVSSGVDTTQYIVAINSTSRENIVYTSDSGINRLIYILNAEDTEARMQYYYYFDDYESPESGITIPKGRWVYYLSKIEFSAYSEQRGNIYFNETDADVYSESYFSSITKTIEENQIFLNSQKEIILKTKDKCCSKDIKIIPLLQKKVITSRGIVIPDEGFSGLDGILVDIPDGVDPTGIITLTKNKTTYNVREYQDAYVDIDPEGLQLGQLRTNFNGVSIAGQYDDVNGYYVVSVNVSGNNMPALQEKTIDTNGEYYPDGSCSGLSKVKIDVHSTLEDVKITENGVYYANNSDGYNKVVVDIPDPSVGTGKYLVRCVDYNGTVLKQNYLNTGAEFIVPDIPDHAGRLNHVDFSKTIIVGNRDITLSPIYYPSSGYSEFDITVNKYVGKTVTFKNLTFNGDVLIDWGDGTSYDGTLSHTYSNYGDYTIKIKNIKTIGQYVFNQQTSTTNYHCKRAFLAETVTKIDKNAFRNCRSLTCITIPNSVTDIGEYAFYDCWSLTSIAIPESVTILYNYTFTNCHSLFSVALPNTLTEIKNNCFLNCYTLNSISLPDSLTNIGFAGTYYWCSSIKKIFIPKGETSLGYAMFRCNYAMQEYDFSTHTSVPTLQDIDCFEGINDLCKIIVPDALYDEWIAADNWSTYANYIYKVSEV